MSQPIIAMDDPIYIIALRRTIDLLLMTRAPQSLFVTTSIETILLFIQNSINYDMKTKIPRFCEKTKMSPYRQE
jgi:hypothetical protein